MEFLEKSPDNKICGNLQFLEECPDGIPYVMHRWSSWETLQKEFQEELLSSIREEIQTGIF